MKKVINVVESPHGRFYQCGSIVLPSVTTVIGSRDAAKWAAWRAESPENAAKADASLARGNAYHAAVEEYFSTGQSVDNRHLRMSVEILKGIEPISVEETLFSPALGVAGRCDLLCRFGGEIVVVDFKTSERSKKSEWLESYWLQLSAYGLMWRERGVTVNKTVIIMPCDDGHMDVHHGNIDLWADALKERIAEFKKNGGTR